MIKVASGITVAKILPTLGGTVLGGTTGYAIGDAAGEPGHGVRNALIGGAIGALSGYGLGRLLGKQPITVVNKATQVVNQTPAMQRTQDLGVADAFVKSHKGDHKYVFLKGNPSLPANLNPDPRGRIRGQHYVKKNKAGKEVKLYPVVVDMFEHPTLKSADGDFADVWVVNSLDEAQKQLQLMIEQGAKQFEPKLMAKLAAGIKIATSVGPGPEARLRPTRKEVVPHEVKNKKRRSTSLVPEVPGAEYICPAAG